MKYIIDTEFNGYKGDLVSMALVREDGEYRYWVLPTLITCEWCLENMEPHIYKGDYILVATTEDLSREIARFLKHDDDPEIICDWPDDIKYFCDTIVFGPGKCRNLKKCSFMFDRSIGTYDSLVPHNALYDALAMHSKYFD